MSSAESITNVIAKTVALQRTKRLNIPIKTIYTDKELQITLKIRICQHTILSNVIHYYTYTFDLSIFSCTGAATTATLPSPNVYVIQLPETQFYYISLNKC